MEFSKISIFFLPNKSIFSKKKFEQVNIFYRNLWIFSKNYLIIFKFYETLKAREIFGEFPYLVEKFPVAAKGIFSAGRLQRRKDYQAPTAVGPGGEGPSTVAKFHFFKRCKVLENKSSFQKYQYFSCLTNLFFLRKNSKKWTYFTGIYEFFEKLFDNFQIWWNLSSPRNFRWIPLSGWVIYSGGDGNFFGANSRARKRLSSAHRSGSGSKGPRTVAKFNFSNDAKY